VVDLVGYTTTELGFLRNEIFARYGRTFRTARYQAHFERQSWYTPKDNFRDSWLSAVDHENIKVILSVERPVMSEIDVIKSFLDRVEYTVPSGPYTDDKIVFLSRNQLTYRETIWNPYFNDYVETDYRYTIFGDYLLFWNPESIVAVLYPHNGGEYLDWQNSQSINLSPQQLQKLNRSLVNG
jgi:hypothetical protein